MSDAIQSQKVVTRGAMSCLPDDVLMEILAHLPVKSLVRFKCVCKKWSAVVENHSFIAKHHQTQAALNNNGCIFIKRGSDCSHFDKFSLLSWTASAVSCIDLVLPFTMELETMEFVRIIGPCNGLFCATHVGNHDITIWNPATREFKSLLRSPNGEYSQWISIGFGFDRTSNDYKVIKISSVFIGEGEDYISKVEVIRLTDNSWRQIDAVPPVVLSRYMTDYVYLKDKFYWQGACNSPEMIVSFDMSTEAFRGIELPDYRCVRVREEFWRGVMELNGSIVLISNYLEINERCFEIWMMNEFGGHVSWSKYMTIEAPMGLWGFPYGFWRNGEILLDDGYGVMLSYDPRTEKITDLGVYVCVFQQVVIYNESLVSIK